MCIRDRITHDVLLPIDQWEGATTPIFMKKHSIALARNETSRSLATVSYTHLDVYKRQPLTPLNGYPEAKRNAAGANSKNKSAAITI